MWAREGGGGRRSGVPAAALDSGSLELGKGGRPGLVWLRFWSRSKRAPRITHLGTQDQGLGLRLGSPRGEVALARRRCHLGATESKKGWGTGMECSLPSCDADAGRRSRREVSQGGNRGGVGAARRSFSMGNPVSSGAEVGGCGLGEVRGLRAELLRRLVKAGVRQSG